MHFIAFVLVPLVRSAPPLFSFAQENLARVMTGANISLSGQHEVVALFAASFSWCPVRPCANHDFAWGCRRRGAARLVAPILPTSRGPRAPILSSSFWGVRALPFVFSVALAPRALAWVGRAVAAAAASLLLCAGTAAAFGAPAASRFLCGGNAERGCGCRKRHRRALPLSQCCRAWRGCSSGHACWRLPL